MEKIIVLGGNGMLGQMVEKFFKKKYLVKVINDRYTFKNRLSFISSIQSEGKGVVINCIGKIKQKTNDLNDLLWTNTVLPLDIQSNLHKDQFLIHPSTDCIFNGNLKEGMYPKSYPSNANDEYGWSKYLGEQALLGKNNALVIRVSIIGPDNNSSSPKGLLGWFLSNSKGEKINGFTNHFWNGITTLEWCKQVEGLIESLNYKMWKGKVLQLGTEQSLSKYELLKLLQKYYKTSYSISKYKAACNVNRCLQPDIFCKSIEEQLYEISKASFNS